MTATDPGRRQLLRWLALGAGAAALLPLGGCGGARPLLLSARSDAAGRHWAVGYGLDGAQAFALPTPQRCHDIVAQPGGRLALFVARRPGTECYLVDTASGRLLQRLEARAQRHFYGHGLFDAAGERLYLTENDLRQPGRGVLGVYRVAGERLRFERELPSHGVEPHQLCWMPGGEVLAVANGGIRTEAGSRRALAPGQVDSSLALVDRDGRLLAHDTLDDPLNSIRHLDVAGDGTLVTGQQYQGGADTPASLVAIKRPGQPLQPLAAQPADQDGMRQYCASVAVHGGLRLAATSAPRGDRLLVWSLDSGRCMLEAEVPDCAGVAAWEDGFVVSSGQNRCRRLQFGTGQPRWSALSLPAGGWDNHLRLA